MMRKNIREKERIIHVEINEKWIMRFLIKFDYQSNSFLFLFFATSSHQDYRNLDTIMS